MLLQKPGNGMKFPWLNLHYTYFCDINILNSEVNNDLPQTQSIPDIDLPVHPESQLEVENLIVIKLGLALSIFCLFLRG